MYRRNSSGPKTAPCKTPEVTDDSGAWPSIGTCWRLFERKLCSYCKVVLSTSYCRSFNSRSWWGILLKAVLKPKRTLSFCSPLSKFAEMSWSVIRIWFSQIWDDILPGPWALCRVKYRSSFSTPLLVMVKGSIFGNGVPDIQGMVSRSSLVNTLPNCSIRMVDLALRSLWEMPYGSPGRRINSLGLLPYAFVSPFDTA